MNLYTYGLSNFFNISISVFKSLSNSDAFCFEFLNDTAFTATTIFSSFIYEHFYTVAIAPVPISFST